MKNKELLKQIFFVPVGIFLIVLPIKTMLAPLGVSGAGTGGIAIIVKHMFDINMSIFVLIVNLILLFISLFVLGKGFFLKTFYGTLLYPLILGLIPEVAITDDIMLSVLFASLSTALGVNILYYLNASSGGTSIPPVILKKYTGLNVSLGLFISDGIVVVASAFVLGIQSFMYSSLLVMLTSVIMESLSSGFSRKKSILIISEQHRAIANDILNKIGRGATYLQAKGAYSEKNLEILMVVLNERDYFKLQSIVNENDPNAFVIVQNAQRVVGGAFRYHTHVVEDE